ncbi:MAG: hypothetical protein V4450_15595 [Bacteroidota bacterium]
MRYLPCFISVLSFFCAGMGAASAATYYSKVATGNFSAVGSWTADTTTNPNAAALTTADIFIIRNGHAITLSGNQTIGSVTIRSGATLTIGGNFTLTASSGLTVNTGGNLGIANRNFTMAGNWTNNGTITVTTGRLVYNTFAGQNNGSISFTTGQLTQTTGSLTNGATGAITFTGAGTISFGTGNFTNNNTSDNVDFGLSVITITGTAASQSIGGFTTTGRFSSTKSSGTLTLTGDLNCNGITMNGSGSTLNLGAGLNHTSTGTIILTAGTMNGGSSVLNVNIVSTTAWQGTGTVFTPGTGTINFNAAGNQTLTASGTKTFYNLTFSTSGTKTITGTTVNNVFSLEGTALSSAAPTYGSGATLQYNTNTARTAGAEWLASFVATGGVFITNTGAITANGNKVFSTNAPLGIDNGATLTTGANSFTFNADFINAGIWTNSTGNVIITGGDAQNIGSITTTGTVSMTKTGNTATLTGNINGGAFTMNGASGTLNLGAGLTHTFTGVWTNTNGTLQGGSSALNISGTVSGTAITFTPNTGTVNYTGTSAQSIPAFTYYDLGFSGAGKKTLAGNTAVGDVLTIDPSSELDLSSVTLNLTGGGTPLVNNGIFTSSTSTVNYSSAVPAVITPLDYNNLNATGGARTLSTTDTIGIKGVFTPGAGSYTVINSIVEFNGSGAQTIPAFTFHDLIVSNAGIKLIAASITVSCQTIAVNDAASIEINADGGGKLNLLQ